MKPTLAEAWEVEHCAITEMVLSGDKRLHVCMTDIAGNFLLFPLIPTYHADESTQCRERNFLHLLNNKALNLKRPPFASEVIAEIIEENDCP